MAGEISSLGIGSGVLTADIIEKLRANDETNIVKPIDTKIETNDKKLKALDLLDSLITTFKSSTGALGDELLYLQREGSVAGDGVSVSVEAGVNVQEFSIRVDQLAKSGVFESGTFTDTDKSIASGDGTLSVNIDNKTYEVEYDSSTTLEGLRDELNKMVGDKLSASIIQVGTDANKLILTSTESGETQNILMSDSGNLNSKVLDKNATVFGSAITSNTSQTETEDIAKGDITINGIKVEAITIPTSTNSEDKAGIIAQAINDANVGATASVIEDNGKYMLYLESTDGGVGDLTVEITGNGSLSGLSNTTVSGNTEGGSTIQEAKDAKFQYNGIDITRSSNNVTDLKFGITLNLLKVKEDDEDLNNVSITQDTTQIVDEMKTFTDNYNTLMKQFDAMLKVDVEEGTVGLFNGDSTLKAMQSQISRLITSVDANGNSLSNFGIDLEQDGTMTFNENRSKADGGTWLNLSEKLAQEPDEVQRFFVGGTYDGVEEEGIFKKLDDTVKDFTSKTGRFTALNDFLDDEQDVLKDDRAAAMKRLDSRYDTMMQRFAAYDSIISKINAQFASLNMQIQAAMNG